MTRLRHTPSAAAIHYEALMPTEPTNAMPGSDDKIRIATERVERGEMPCHPDDLRLESVHEWQVPETGRVRYDRLGSRILVEGTFD